MKIQIRGKGDRTCPYCRDGFGGLESALPCLRCGVMIHSECAEELSLCPVLGCGGRFRNPAPSVRDGSPRRSGSSSSFYRWIAAAGALFVFGIFGYTNFRSQPREVRPKRFSPRNARTEVRDPKKGPVDLTKLATVLRPHTIQIALRPQPGNRIQIVIRAGDVLEVRVRKGDYWIPSRMISAENVSVTSGGRPETFHAAHVEPEFLATPHQTIIDSVREVDSTLADERIASRLMHRLARAEDAPWQARLAAYRIRLHDLEREELLGHLPFEEREVVLQGAYELLGRFSFLSDRPRALRGFQPLQQPSDFLPTLASRLRPYETFRPLRRAKDSQAVERIAHSYAKIRLTPAQAISLWHLHKERGDPRQFGLSDVLAQLGDSKTLAARLLWIAHVQDLDPLLGRGLQAAHAEDGLFQTPGALGSAAQKLASWKTLVGQEYLSGGIPQGLTRLQLVEREVSARARILADTLQDAKLGRRGQLLVLAAHAPRDPQVVQLCDAVRAERPSAVREAALATIWLARASERPDFKALIGMDLKVRSAATEEAAFALDPPQRERLWHALIEAGHPSKHLSGVFEGLVEHDRAAPGDLAAWCALVHDSLTGRTRVIEALGGAEALWALVSRARELDPRGRLGLVKFLYPLSGDVTKTTERLLSLIHADEARVEVLDVFAERHGEAATQLAIRLGHGESVLWRQKAIRLALKHLEGRPLEVLIRRGLRDRSQAVRLTALEGMHVFALQPRLLRDLCRARNREIARAAWLQLAKSDARLASGIGRTWAHSREPAQTQLAFSLAKEIHASRPTLSRQLLEELAKRSQDPEIRRQAAALLR